MVKAMDIKLVMSEPQLAICLHEGRITRDSLVQQIGPLQQICLQTVAKTQCQKILGPIVEVESDEIGCWRLFNCQFLRTRNFRAKPLSDFSRELALDCKYVIQIAIVFFRPHERASTSVYQSGLEVETGTSAITGHSTLQDVRNSKGLTNFRNIPFSAILHYAGVADHPEIADAREFGQNVILNAIGENGVLFILAQTFEGENSNAGCCCGPC